MTGEGIRRIEYLTRAGKREVTLQWGKSDEHARERFEKNCGGKETFIRILKDLEITHQTKGNDE
jgi:hypothetical protein